MRAPRRGCAGHRHGHFAPSSSTRSITASCGPSEVCSSGAGSAERRSLAHIGPQETDTTWLQQVVFSEANGYSRPDRRELVRSLDRPRPGHSDLAPTADAIGDEMAERALFCCGHPTGVEPPLGQDGDGVSTRSGAARRKPPGSTRRGDRENCLHAFIVSEAAGWWSTSSCSAAESWAANPPSVFFPPSRAVPATKVAMFTFTPTTTTSSRLLCHLVLCRMPQTCVESTPEFAPGLSGRPQFAEAGT